MTYMKENCPSKYIFVCEAEERDIRDAVVQIVDRIGKKIVDFEPKFRIGRQILVGSAGGENADRSACRL